jgi:uncharacterized membrane protein YhaH (DUF805 family)
MNYYTDVLKKYAAFNGRARRQEYWMFTLFNALAMIVLAILAVAASKYLFVLYGIYFLAVIIPSLAVLVRRLHDIGKSGGWFWILVVPLIGGLWLLVLTCIAGNPGPNQYGPDPKLAG